jgi:hypothetical protein
MSERGRTFAVECRWKGSIYRSFGYFALIRVSASQRKVQGRRDIFAANALAADVELFGRR